MISYRKPGASVVAEFGRALRPTVTVRCGHESCWAQVAGLYRTPRGVLIDVCVALTYDGTEGDGYREIASEWTHVWQLHPLATLAAKFPAGAFPLCCPKRRQAHGGLYTSESELLEWRKPEPLVIPPRGISLA